MNIETTASMQEQLARRDHRIAVLEAIVAAKTARIAKLEELDGGTAMSPPFHWGTEKLACALALSEGHSLALSRAIASDKPLDAYGRR